MNEPPKKLFTLPNLIAELEDHYEIVFQQEDEWAEIRALGHTVPDPLFRVRVVSPKGDMIEAVSEIASRIWSIFGRGLMNFDAQSENGRVLVMITELPPSKDSA